MSHAIFFYIYTVFSFPNSNFYPSTFRIEFSCKKVLNGIAIYLYTRNFETAPKSISCTTRKGEKNTLKYENYWYNDLELNKEILKIVHTKIKGEDVTPIYAHCWNGWHASGLIAALALRQFCNVSPERAVSYWMRGADGTADNTKAYDSLKRKIRNFTPSPSLTLTESERSLFCPSID